MIVVRIVNGCLAIVVGDDETITTDHGDEHSMTDAPDDVYVVRTPYGVLNFVTQQTINRLRKGPRCN